MNAVNERITAELVIEPGEAEGRPCNRHWGAALLQVDRTLHFAQAETAVFARMYCRTDRLVFSQRIGGGNPTTPVNRTPVGRPP